MGTPILQGRDFGPRGRSRIARTAIVNRTFVNRYLADRIRSACSSRPAIRNPDTANMFTVVGVVDDIRQKSVEREARARVLYLADADADPAADDGRGDVTATIPRR